MFFKEGEKEDLACQGARVVEQLVERRKLDIAELPRDGKDPRLWKKHDAVLDASLCQHCLFKREDCDFQSESPPPHAEPCGGYMLLALLKENSIITPLDLEGISLE